MSRCLFVSDLHGSRQRYEKLFDRIASRKPEIVFLGGDLLPFEGLFPMRAESGGGWQNGGEAAGAKTPGGDTASAGAQAGDKPGGKKLGGFLSGLLLPRLQELKVTLGSDYPLILAILGNDDPRREEGLVKAGQQAGLWRYLHNTRIAYREFRLYGYSYVPPTPFLLKDWERYDVSRYTDVGAVAPSEGRRSVPVPAGESEGRTIQQDLLLLSDGDDLSRAVFLFHAPPYGSKLDRAGLDATVIDGAPVDVHVGSIAVRRFIEQREPYLTLHGHVHESARLTGAWRERIANTLCFSAAHDGPELAVVEFVLEEPEAATRTLI